MDSETSPIAEAGAASAEVPGVYIISCFKCTREYELHGRKSLLALNLDYEGWVRIGERMVCPRCPCASETPKYNKAREEARRARRVKVAA